MHQQNKRRRLSTTAYATDRRMGELTEPEQKVYDFLSKLHDSKYQFRVVVVGKGAILETTTELGPTLKVSQSPSTGANLMTLASEDQTFEFHVQLTEVSKIMLVEKETPSKVMRIIRMLNSEGGSICSLILAETSDKAIKWYADMQKTYGSEVVL